MNEKELTNLLSADLSGESKIKESLKLKLLTPAPRKRAPYFALSGALACAAAVIMVLIFKPHSAPHDEYEYAFYPMSSLEQYSDGYGASGPRGLITYITETNV